MPFSGQGSNIYQADDVVFSTITDGQVMRYNGTTAKWNNVATSAAVSGIAALANQGGLESVLTANATGSYDVNLASGNVFNLTLTGNTTLTFSGATNLKACSCTIYIKQGSPGSRTLSWPTSVRWAGGTAPTISTTTNAVDIFVLETLNGGTTWYASLVGNNFS